MFSSAKKRDYSSVPSNDDIKEDDDGSSVTDDLEHSRGQTSPPRRRQIRPRARRFRRQSCCYGCYSTFIMTLVGIAAMSAIVFFVSQTPWGKSVIEKGQNRLSLSPPTNDNMDESTVEEVETDSKSTSATKNHKVHYDPTASLQSVNPFDFQMTDAVVFTTPSLLQQEDASSSKPQETIGYLTHPHVVNNNIVFCSEGDAFVTTIGETTESLAPAVKLTKTVGNVLDPKLHSSLRYLAYTATYTGHRDLYLMDLVRPQSAAIRLTYWETGVRSLVGWWGNSLVFQARSNEVSLPDSRLYVLHLSNLEGDERRLKKNATDSTSAGTDSHANEEVSVLQIDPVPLSQAIDASRYDSCWYFVRFQQSSNTMRYVGGTAESLWKYCDGEEKATALTSDFKGTSKSPQVYNDDYLFFLSDRTLVDNKWQTDRMNVWAMPLHGDTSELLQITDTACDFEGRTIREYSVDAQTGNLVIRIGADLYLMEKAKVDQKLSSRRLMRTRTLDEGEGNKSSEGTGIEQGDSAATQATALDSSTSTFSPVPTITEDDQLDDGLETETQTDESGKPGQANITADMESNATDLGIPDDPEATKATSDSSTSTFSPVPTITEDDQLDEDLDSEKQTEEPAELGQANITADIETNATALGINVTNTTEKQIPKVYYEFDSPELESRKKVDYQDHHSGTSDEIKRLNIVVHSDFSSHQERIIPVKMNRHLTSMDVYTTPVGTTQAIMTLRGQLWVAPVADDDDVPEFLGGGMNLPPRRYRVAPGAMMGGVVRILAVRHVPNPVEDDQSDRRLAVILATDPLTETAEHAFYLIETQAGATPTFLDMDHLPKPFLGGHVGGGSTFDGGLGSVKPETFVVSPCGRRMTWSDTDGRIMVMNMPQYQDLQGEVKPKYEQLPKENELGEPMVGDEVGLRFSPGGRYLAVEHNARNQFTIISIVDLGDPAGDEKVADIQVGRIVQATPSRFNSGSPYWGKSGRAVHEIERAAVLSALLGSDEPSDVSDVLYFLSDRDIQTDVNSPWGTRQPMPHFQSSYGVFALPLSAINATETEGYFTGGGASELSVQEALNRQGLIKSLKSVGKGRKLHEQETALTGVFGIAGASFDEKKRRYRRLQEAIDVTPDADSNNTNTTLRPAEFPSDMDIDFGSLDLSFARQAYRIATIPEGNYGDIMCQTSDAGALVLIEEVDGQPILTIMTSSPFPSDNYEVAQLTTKAWKLAGYGLSTSRQHLYLSFTPIQEIVVVPTTVAGIQGLIADADLEHNKVDADNIHLSVWPALEYRQLYDDAWRMLRDYFYDPEMTGIDWPLIHERYIPLVARCTKREELDDVLAQMASELSALHVFVYGGEYEQPQFLDRKLQDASVIASFGAVLKRSPEWKGYQILSIPEHDPDFNMVDGSEAVFSPLSEHTLRLSGQRGLQVGDVIVGVNGESVMKVPHINMLLRGMQGRSVRLDVLRLSSGDDLVEESEVVQAETTPLITVALSPDQATDLQYNAWEWKTKQLATKLAEEAGFSVGYVHLRDMSGPEAENAFARAFFPNYDKEAFILDVRHNNGGNIDSWILDVLQKQAWMYWQSRDFDTTNGGLGWDQQFAFRGHIVVLIDEKTSSDGEGVSRGISELGLGRLIGTRTWGGGIWLASDNQLVDGGIATAPEIGTYNDKFGWGMGIEQMGVEPDIVVDNDPHQTYNGKDSQLERAIAELKDWLEQEPIVVPQPPKKNKDMSMGDRECTAK